MKKQFLIPNSAFLILLVMVSLLGLFSLTASAEAASDLTVTIDTDASVTLKDADGDGYYDIGTADELYAFAAAVNGGNTDINGELTAHITINQNVIVNGELNSNTEGFRAWTPIGSFTVPYTGSFEGNGKTVSGLYFNNSSAKFVGLFGYVNDQGSLQNIGVVDSYLCADA